MSPPETMQAAVCTAYGPPETLVLVRLPVPRPRDGQVRVRIHAATVSAADRRIRSLDMPAGLRLAGRLAFGWRRPRQPVLGGDFSGVIDAVGAGVTGFQPGDEVAGMTGVRMGCHAGFCCLHPEGRVLAKPANLSHETAVAALFGGTAAVDFLRRAGLQEGERILIVGASGAVGSAAVQWASRLGAHVTAVCSGRNAAWVAPLGAARVIDYTRQDWPGRGAVFDVVLDATGTLDWLRVRPWLQPKGRFLSLAGGLKDMLRAPWVAATSRQRIVAGPAGERLSDMQLLMRAAADGSFAPHIDAVYPLERIRDAHRHVDSGRKRGSVIVTP
ncbi:MAG: NAD(P)-dependent alcohol dehydrogenase [Thiobacillus sp.]|nr:NAD(P)-dependent alcohol dehydrogenase [Thiobacillus sp.]